jgi:hypothetical protein
MPICLPNFSAKIFLKNHLVTLPKTVDETKQAAFYLMDEFT